MVATAVTQPSGHLAEENVVIIFVDSGTYVSKLSRIEIIQLGAGSNFVNAAGTAIATYVSHSGNTITFNAGGLSGTGTAYVTIKGRL